MQMCKCPVVWYVLSKNNRSRDSPSTGQAIQNLLEWKH